MSHDASRTDSADSSVPNPGIFELAGPIGRLSRWVGHTGLSYLVFRYRYLGGFLIVGLLSIVLELAVLRLGGPSPVGLRSAFSAFLLGMVFSFTANAAVTFCVPRTQWLRTFGYFAGVSLFSFSLNMLAVRTFARAYGTNYDINRLISAGLLFFIAYTLHRRYTFEQSRNLGVAVYLTESQNPVDTYERIGQNCDHVHVDLVDETMARHPEPVQLGFLEHVRRLWPRRPVAMHVMSTRPQRWIETTLEYVDWYLLHVEAEDNLFDLIALCRANGKKVGLVWRPGIQPSAVFPYLPHVDFTMVLGVARPGESGQQLHPRALDVARMLFEMRSHYAYDTMFDGGVKPSNISSIPAKYVVARSGVLHTPDPICASFSLRSARSYREDLAKAVPLIQQEG